MARLPLVIQTVGRNGKDIGNGQSVLNADGAEVANDGATRFKMVNSTGAPIIVTFVTPITLLSAPALTVADQEFSVPNNAERWIGPFPTDAFNEFDGLMDIDVAADGVTMTAVN